jgi:hypothetical protein
MDQIKYDVFSEKYVLICVFDEYLIIVKVIA